MTVVVLAQPALMSEQVKDETRGDAAAARTGLAVLSSRPSNYWGTSHFKLRQGRKPASDALQQPPLHNERLCYATTLLG
jgi:hypothetical protein